MSEAGRELRAIQKWNLLVLAAAIGFAAWRFGPRAAESVAVGGVIGATNFWLTSRVVRGTFAGNGNTRWPVLLKFLGLFGGVGLVMWAVQPESNGFAAGFVSILLTVVLKAIVAMVTTKPDEQTDVKVVERKDSDA